MLSLTPDLCPPTSPLAPVFPLGSASRPLVLYPGAAGEIRVRWRLRADEIVTRGAEFPPDDGAPEPVLRLGRVRAEGGSEPVGERCLRLSGLGGHGETAFQVDDDMALFEAELGLRNPEGGWLLLARSNRLQQARRLGLESLRQSRPLSRAESRCHSDTWNHPSEAVPEDAEAFEPVSVATAIPVLTYADPALPARAVAIEAELRIHGWSAPNADIDLFGHRYRVGPGGRFQLSLKVDDPELIRRALEHHRPPESGDRH